MVSQGKYKARITVSVEPYHFNSEACQSQLSAKAKVMYIALKYMNEMHGCSVLDMNHESRLYIQNMIQGFDIHVKMVTRCAGQLFKLNNSFLEQFTKMLQEVGSKISMHSDSNEVLHSMANTRIRVSAVKAEFCLALYTLMTKKVRFHLTSRLLSYSR